MIRWLALLILAMTPVSTTGLKASEIRNVLLIVSDDLKASVLGCYGDRICKTPNIDALAERSMVFERAYCQGLSCHPSRQSFMHSRYVGDEGSTIGEHLIGQGFYSARVGKIFHMRVPGDIIAGTNGNDIPETWTERFNCEGQEAHTPGLYRLLNFNIETRDLENRQSTKMPHRMFASVESDGDGSEQPDWKAAEKTVELLKQRARSDQRFFLATGFVRPHYPSVAPASYFEDYPYQEIPSPKVPEGDLDDIPELVKKSSTSQKTGIDKFPDNIKKMWADYYATVTFMDEQLG
ncbi:MAG: sulfatase-like hydrolase/transferase, partial [Verrucomicrobiales bacterium]|nr:sulfatase-like hydrolase/transferase [Verrucomicrobiales bacterium]